MQVTVILLTYNQQEFIGEALESVLMQRHAPLEIIISDDCSSDATFRIVKQRVASYDGPHHVRVNRNDKNLGLIRHVEWATMAAQGEIIVAAAGDDISSVDRVSHIMAAFDADPSCVYVHSAATRIDRHSKRYEKIEPPILQAFASPHAAAASHCLAIGATAAWRKTLISDFPPIVTDVWAEDLVLGFRALLCGTVSYIDEPLVEYRSDSGITSKRPSMIIRHSRNLCIRKQRFRDSLNKLRIDLCIHLYILIIFSSAKLFFVKLAKVGR